MYLARNHSSNSHFNMYWMWKYLTAQLIIGKIVRKAYPGVEWNLELIPQFQLAHNQWLHFGIGISWLEYTFNFGLPTNSYYDNFKRDVEKTNAHA